MPKRASSLSSSDHWALRVLEVKPQGLAEGLDWLLEQAQASNCGTLSLAASLSRVLTDILMPLRQPRGSVLSFRK